MPKSKDPQGGGTETGGSKSTEYCSNCYQNGKFTEPDITAEGMVAKVRTMMEHDMHLPKFVSWWFARSIPRLKRWQKL